MDEIMQLKDKLLRHASKSVDERGADRIDPEIYDAIKDLSEAAYYCKVTEQMGNEQMGYMHDGMRYGYYEPMGYQMRDSRGRYMGYGDSVEAVRNILASASPEEKERIKAEMRSM
jgi:hypothetical protein